MHSSSRLSGVFARLVKADRGLVVLSVLMLMVACVAALAPLVSPYDPLDPILPLQPPSGQFLLGTDEIGRDLMSRLIFGARVSLSVAGLGTLIAAGLGTAIGMFAAYFRSADALLMRVMDALWAYPSLLLALGIGVAIGPGFTTLVVTIAVVNIPVFARLTYGQTLAAKQYDFVTAAVALGASHARVLWRLLPNVAAPVIVQVSLSFGAAVIFEASLSFLGMGIQPPTPSWGSMLRSGYRWMELAPAMAVAPGLAIYFVVMVTNLLGDRLRSALDPKA